MASLISIPQSNPQLIFARKKCLQTPQSPYHISLNMKFGSIWLQNTNVIHKKKWKNVIISQIKEEKSKGFVGELRSTAMRWHTKEQAPKEGLEEVKRPEQRHVAKWDFTIDGYLRFLVDSKLVYDTLEGIIENATLPPYVELKDTGLERSVKLAKDLEWFKEEGYVLPEPSEFGVAHAHHLKELSEKNYQELVCHFYNLYFGHTAGGQIMGKRVSEKILNHKELEFYKWEGDVSPLLQNLTFKLNKIAESWTREEKDRCLGETETAFKLYGNVIRLIMT